MFKIKYCVASVETVGGTPYVAFYAYREGSYGLHKVDDWNDPAVQWYDTQEEAMKARWNPNDCVISRGFEGGEGQS